MRYDPWRRGFDGEGFLVGTGTDDFELALYRSQCVDNPIHFILFVTEVHAGGDPSKLFAAIGTDAVGRFILRVKRPEMSLWRLSLAVTDQNPQLKWAGPSGLAPAVEAAE